jgi:hypothetical protein
LGFNNLILKLLKYFVFFDASYNSFKKVYSDRRCAYDCFSLINAENIPGFVKVTKIIPINPDEEEYGLIW